MENPKCQKLREEIKAIRGKYDDPRKKSWNREYEEEILEETLQKEKAIEEIVKIIGERNFSVSESEDILLEAQKRIKISTPVRITGRYQNILSKENDKDSLPNTQLKNH